MSVFVEPIFSQGPAVSAAAGEAVAPACGGLLEDAPGMLLDSRNPSLRLFEFPSTAARAVQVRQVADALEQAASYGLFDIAGARVVVRFGDDRAALRIKAVSGADGSYLLNMCAVYLVGDSAGAMEYRHFDGAGTSAAPARYDEVLLRSRAGVVDVGDLGGVVGRVRMCQRRDF